MPPSGIATSDRIDSLPLPIRHADDIFVDGVWTPADSSERRGVIDPATAHEWGSVPIGNSADLGAAVSSARRAFDRGRWPRMAPSERAAVLRRAADRLELLAQPLALTNTLENGTPVAESGGGATNAASIFRYFATLAPLLESDDVRPAPAGTHETLVRRDPIGVCALIAPWNFPINLVVVKLAPALLAGCTVVIKPASLTPLSVRFIVQALTEAGIPPGVVNVVTGSGELGDQLVRHPDIDKVAFTGSTEVGRKIARQCGELLRPVTLELGGKSSAIVLPDADLGVLRSALIRSTLRNTGQTCYISTRILVPDSRHDEIVATIVGTVAAAPQGDPLDPATVFGPSASVAQKESVLAHIAGARAQGAHVALGGDAASMPAPFSAGNFVEPTVLTQVSRDMSVAREEIFGPVLTVLRYGDVDEAVDLANATEFGLGGIVFGGDETVALQVAERVDSGSVGVNFFASNHAAPFGGRRDSGLGVEYGPEGLHAYLTYKSIHRRRRKA
ncbi:MAG: aldehyde dehydrogenase family protein [Microbacterium sp.]|uniref:aldehyde dehydrogenase family protein n=1 Tax=Microbacterium sp. TaxID=51671 RepID=UPI002715EFCC|nr:aldehyde dehydrogenase family protein [Microbacterium sp.]MDO8382035.1 aldehyde dehydrogenase family protein [Microbacterium sp.]